MNHLPVAALLALFAAPALLVGCLPASEPPDGRAPPVEEAPAALSMSFVWPDGAAEVGDDAVRFDELRRFPLRVRLENRGSSAVRVALDALVMRPVDETADPEDGFVEAVFESPPAFEMRAGEVRELGYGDVWLFFGFACTLHVTGEISPAGAPERAASVVHHSRPVLVGVR